MNKQEAAEVFNNALIGETNPERIAQVEMMREYFCNPDFRAYMENEIARLNGVQ
jgi:hypothetical protein